MPGGYPPEGAVPRTMHHALCRCRGRPKFEGFARYDVGLLPRACKPRRALTPPCPPVDGPCAPAELLPKPPPSRLEAPPWPAHQPSPRDPPAGCAKLRPCLGRKALRGRGAWRERRGPPHASPVYKAKTLGRLRLCLTLWSALLLRRAALFSSFSRTRLALAIVTALGLLPYCMKLVTLRAEH